jgi:hypothetical protein
MDEYRFKGESLAAAIILHANHPACFRPKRHKSNYGVPQYCGPEAKETRRMDGRWDP